jgi:hypothetical protein
MSNSRDYRPPRLSVNLTEEQANALREVIPWGLKSALFQVIVDDIIELAKKHGQVFIAALLDRKIRLSRIIKFEIEDGDD